MYAEINLANRLGVPVGIKFTQQINIANNAVQKQMTIQQQIDDFLRRQNEDRQGRQRSGKLSPSSFGRCYRYQWWHWHNETQTNPPDERARRVFACGDLFHDYIKKFIEADFEVLAENEYIKGYADAVTKDEVIEIKSQHSKSFWHMSEDLKTKTISEIRSENVLQGAAYCMLLGKPFLRLVYVSKDDLCINEFKINVTNGLKQKVTDEVNALRGFVELPEAEPRAFGFSRDGKPKECEYCPYLNKCKEKGGAIWERLRLAQK